MNVARSDEADLTDYSDRAWFQQARDGQEITFQSLISRTTGRPALVVAAPIRNEDEEIVGVGMFAAELAELTANVPTSVGTTGYGYVIDTNNMAIIDAKADYSAGLPDLSSEPAVQYLRGGNEGITTFADADGVQWRAYVHALENGWGVIVQQPEAELLASCAN
jgi:hypothetical protein